MYIHINVRAYFRFQDSRSSSGYRNAEIVDAVAESRPLTVHSDIVMESRTTLLRPGEVLLIISTYLGIHT
jgi:hypothetical protein